jgi:hypothetical protein
VWEQRKEAALVDKMPLITKISLGHYFDSADLKLELNYTSICLRCFIHILKLETLIQDIRTYF